MRVLHVYSDLGIRSNGSVLFGSSGSVTDGLNLPLLGVVEEMFKSVFIGEVSELSDDLDELSSMSLILYEEVSPSTLSTPGTNKCWAGTCCCDVIMADDKVDGRADGGGCGGLARRGSNQEGVTLRAGGIAVIRRSSIGSGGMGSDIIGIGRVAIVAATAVAATLAAAGQWYMRWAFSRLG